MGIKRVALCDQEADYVKKFIRQAQVGLGRSLRFVGITSEEGFGAQKNIDLNRGFWTKALLEEYEGRCVLLCEERLPKEFHHMSGVFKYRSVSALLNELYRTKAWESVMTRDFNPYVQRGKVICIYSPGGNPENTCYAMSLGNALAEESKVIYINLKANQDYVKAFGLVDGEGLGDLLCHMNRGQAIGEIRQFLRDFGDMQVIMPLSQCAQASEVKDKDLDALTEFIRSQGLFDYIIYDLGEITEGILKVFLDCDIRVLISGSGTMERVSIDKFKENLSLAAEGEIAIPVLYRDDTEQNQKIGEPLYEEVTGGRYRQLVNLWLRKNGGVFEDEE